MGLAEVQSAMARLFVDPEVRQQFIDDPTAIGTKFGLSSAETELLARAPQCQFECFGNSLARKRRDQVRRALPNTARVLGREFTRLFDRYANDARPRGSRADLVDVAEFVAALQCRKRTVKPIWVVDLARYELAWRRSARPGPRIMARLFRFPVCRLMGGGEPAPISLRPTLAIWWSLPGQHSVRHLVISAPDWLFRGRP